MDIFYGDLPSDLEDNLAQVGVDTMNMRFFEGKTSFLKGYGYNFQTGEVVETAPWVDRESFYGSGGLRCAKKNRNLTFSRKSI